jgi:hypothetical protein
MPTLTVTVTSRTGSGTLTGTAGFSSDLNPYDAGAPENWEGQGLLWTSQYYWYQDEYQYTALTEKLVFSNPSGSSTRMVTLASYYDALASDPYLVNGTNPEASSTSIDLIVPETFPETLNFTVTAVSLNISLTGGTADTPYFILLKLLDTNSNNIKTSFTLNSDVSGNINLDYQLPQPRVGETLTYVSASYREAYPQRALTTDERLQALENP